MANFFVVKLNRKKLSLFLALVIISICGCICCVNRDVLEVSNADRLLPIYSVETDKKQVALTFDCAWSRSQ